MYLSVRIIIIIFSILFIKNDVFSQSTATATISATVITEQVGIQTTDVASVKNDLKEKSGYQMINSFIAKETAIASFKIIGNENEYTFTFSSSQITLLKPQKANDAFIVVSPLNITKQTAEITINYN